jgi:hypothetical protein
MRDTCDGDSFLGIQKKWTDLENCSPPVLLKIGELIGFQYKYNFW